MPAEAVRSLMTMDDVPLYVRDALPPAVETPLDAMSPRLARMGRRDRELLDELAGGRPVFVLERTGAAVDVGLWFRKRRVWAACLADELVLFTAGKIPYTERAGAAAIGASLYNHVTGEVVLAPAEGIRIKRLRMGPVEGYQVLAQIRNMA